MSNRRLVEVLLVLHGDQLHQNPGIVQALVLRIRRRIAPNGFRALFRRLLRRVPNATIGSGPGETTVETVSESDAATAALNGAIARVAPMHLSVSWGDRLLTLDKSADFLEEPRFSRAFESVKGSHQYDQYIGPDTIAWRLNTLCWAARCGLRAGGDFVECGVFKGDMAWVVSQTLGIENIPCYWLYDSFEGFSPEWSTPDDYPQNPGFLEFANQHYRQQGMYEYVAGRFAAFEKMRVVKGFLPEALAKACPEHIGFLHIDLNSPRAEVAVLEKLFDRVTPGGVIVFDDYGWKLFHKQKEAEDAFMAKRGYEILELPTGQGLVIKR